MAGLSRAALGGVAFLLTLLTHGGGAVGTQWIRNASESPVGDLGMLTGLMTILMLSSGVLALFVGDCLFGLRWRQALLGVVVPLGDDEIPDIPRNESLRFSFLLIAVLALNGVALDQITMGGFSEYYGGAGYSRTVLRGTNEASRREVLIQLAQVPGRELASHAMEVILPMAREGDSTSVRVAAFDALGIVGERMAHSVDLIVLGRATAGGWESDLMVRLRKDPLDEAHRCFAGEDEEALVIACLAAIEGIRSVESIPILSQGLEKSSSGAVREAIIVALAGMRGHLRAVVPLATALRDPSSSAEERALALYGVGEVVGHWRPNALEASRAIPEEATLASEVMNEVVPSLDLRGSCVLVDALRKMRDARTAPALFSVFEGAEAGVRCASDSRLRPGRRELQLSRDEGLRFRSLRGIAHIAKGNATVVKWLEEQEGRIDALSPKMIREIGSLRQRVAPGGSP